MINIRNMIIIRKVETLIRSFKEEDSASSLEEEPSARFIHSFI
jgi:hypothetical protein